MTYVTVHALLCKLTFIAKSVFTDEDLLALGIIAQKRSGAAKAETDNDLLHRCLKFEKSNDLTQLVFGSLSVIQARDAISLLVNCCHYSL